MAIVRHIFRHRLHGMIAINDRKTLQNIEPRFMQLNFTGFNTIVYLRDSFVVQDGIKLHTGLNITTVIEGDPVEKLDSIIESITVQIMGIFTFATVASCGDLRLLSHITIQDDDTGNVIFLSYPMSCDEIIVGTPRAIDEKIFAQVWQHWDKSTHKERLNKALIWFAKGLGEEHTIDKFFSYWISIEVLASTLRRMLQQKVRNPGEWAGVEMTFARLGNQPSFKEVYGARGQLFHGFGEFTPDFFEKINSYVEPARKAALSCISDVLELPTDTTEELVSLSPRRLLTNLTIETKGNLKGLPRDIQELLNNPPDLKYKVNSIKYELDQNGKLSYNVNHSQTFYAPVNCSFMPNEGGVKGHAEAGIMDVKSR